MTYKNDNVTKMNKKIKIIEDFCKKEGFRFVNCDKENKRLPCSLDRNYKKDNQTIFVKGFFIGSNRIGLSWGGLKQWLSLNTPIDLIEDEWINQRCLPGEFICNSCKKHNLNLSTQDNHKTYDCPDCQIKEENNGRRL